MPCVGDGAILRVLRQDEPEPPRTYITNDLDPARVADHHFDARDPMLWSKRFVPQGIYTDKIDEQHFKLVLEEQGLVEIDWVVDNPPFSAAYQILLAARKFVTQGVALHLRLSFEEPTLEREEFITQYPPDGRLILPRYRFDQTKKGTDSVCTAWLIWLCDPVGMQRIAYPFSEELHATRTLVAHRAVIDELMERPDGGPRESEDSVVPATPGTGTAARDTPPAAEE